MRVIVSTELADNYRDYKVVSSVRDVIPMSNVEYVVIHTFSDNDVVLASAISELRSKFSCTFFYINVEPKAVLTLLLGGIKGEVIEDEYYLESEEDLSALLESYTDDSTSLVVDQTQSSLSVVRDFVTAFARGEERCSLPYFIQQTNTALATLEATIDKKEMQIQEMGSSALDVFKRASEYIGNLQEKNKQFAKQLEQITQQASAPRNKFGQGGISFYPTVKYNVSPTKKLLVIREYSSCKYLTSLVLAYQTYLKTMKNKRVKVIFTVQKGKLIYTKYSSELFTFISQESQSHQELYHRETIVTNSPQSKALTSMIDAGTYDIVIVVDRLFGSDVILTGTNVKHLSAVGGSSDISRFKLQPRNCIFSHTGLPNAFLTIPTISKYPPATAPDMRISAYTQMCSVQNLFGVLDKFIEVEGRR